MTLPAEFGPLACPSCGTDHMNAAIGFDTFKGGCFVELRLMEDSTRPGYSQLSIGTYLPDPGEPPAPKHQMLLVEQRRPDAGPEKTGIVLTPTMRRLLALKLMEGL